MNIFNFLKLTEGKKPPKKEGVNLNVGPHSQELANQTMSQAEQEKLKKERDAWRSSLKSTGGNVKRFVQNITKSRAKNTPQTNSDDDFLGSLKRAHPATWKQRLRRTKRK